MTICRQALSVVLSFSVTVSVIGLDGCKKSEQAESNQTQQQNQQGQAPATTNAVPTADQLYQLVAPIALFPDNLLAQVLAASTFPSEVTAAYNWVQQNSSLKGQQLMEAVNQQSWDVSVKGLTEFPDVLNQMAANLSWTSALGDAYFNIPQSVMNAVQVMRQRAQQAGNLKSTPQQNVTVQNQAPAAEAPAPASSGEQQVTVVQPPAQTIVIQPAQPEVVYVPTYNPTAVYGAPVAAYPGYSTGDVVATGLISFGVGMMIGAAINNNNNCCGWGYNSWGAGWNNSTVVYNRNTYVSTSNTFVNRNNYYNRNNVNTANINRNNINTNDINRNNINNNRANNFNNNGRNSNYTTPNFNKNDNAAQFQNNRGNQAQNNRGNVAQNNGQRPGGGNQPNFNQQNRPAANQQNRPGTNQQNRPGAGQNQSRPGGGNQPQRDASRGYGQQPNRGASNSALGGYSEGGNARTNSARGQQSMSQNRAPASGGGGGNRAQAGGGGGNRGGGGGGKSGGGGGGSRPQQQAQRQGGGARR